MYLLEDPGVWSTVHCQYLLKGAIYNVFDNLIQFCLQFFYINIHLLYKK